MSRSLKKGPHVDRRLLDKVERQQGRGHRETGEFARLCRRARLLFEQMGLMRATTRM